MNATIILSVALAMLSVAGSVKASSAEKFAYNTELDTNNQVVTQCVYKVEDGKYLHQQVKYHFVYDDQNLWVLPSPMLGGMP